MAAASFFFHKATLSPGKLLYSGKSKQSEKQFPASWSTCYQKGLKTLFDFEKVIWSDQDSGPAAAAFTAERDPGLDKKGST